MIRYCLLAHITLTTHFDIARDLQSFPHSHRRLLEHARHVLLRISAFTFQFFLYSCQSVFDLVDGLVVSGQILLEDLRLEEDCLSHLVPIGEAFGFEMNRGLHVVVEESFDAFSSLGDFYL